MRTTASYDLFPDARSERALARARWLAREGRTQDAQSAYDELLAAKPELKAGWAEYFELLRAGGRREEALRLADRARATFGETGFSFTLRGAALTELGRYREALAELERAGERLWFPRPPPSRRSDRRGALVCGDRQRRPGVPPRTCGSERRDDRGHVRGGRGQLRLALRAGDPARPGVPRLQRSRGSDGSAARHPIRIRPLGL